MKPKGATTTKFSKNTFNMASKRRSVIHNVQSLNLNNADNSYENCLQHVTKYFKVNKIDCCDPDSISMKHLIHLVNEKFKVKMSAVQASEAIITCFEKVNADPTEEQKQLINRGKNVELELISKFSIV